MYSEGILSVGLMLTLQKQPTHIIISEERERSSGKMTPATSVPQHPVTAPGAGWSGASSQPVGSRPQSQRNGEGQGDVLDATTIQISEVNNKRICFAKRK
jgi:hypothetical protein